MATRRLRHHHRRRLSRANQPMIKRLGIAKPYWYLSKKAMGHNVECTPAGIAKCRGACCTAKFWPGSASPQANGYCFYHTPTGCRLPVAQRPVTCLLYPLKVKPHPTLPGAGVVIIHNNSRFPRVSCYPNVGACGCGVLILFVEAFVHIFGGAQYQALLGGANHARPVDHVLRAYMQELEMEQANILPQPRGC